MAVNNQEYIYSSDQSKVIDRLYDVTVNPIHYEELVDAWSEIFSLTGFNGEVPPDDGDEEFGGHAQRASDLLDRHQPCQPFRSSRSQLYDVKTRAAFITDGFEKILAVNAIGSKSLDVSDGSPMSALPFRAVDLQALKDVPIDVGQQGQSVSVIMRIRRSDSNRPVILRVTAVESEEPLPIVLVVLAEIAWLEGFSAHLYKTFDLTPAEAEVCRHIVSGLTARDISMFRGTSIETVRTQIKSLLEKTEASSQTDLVRIIVGLLDVMSLTEDSENDAPSSAQTNNLEFQSMILSDGRRYDFRVFGDPDGLDCLYFHMDLGLVAWPEEAEAAAYMEGLRVIVPVRAGFGYSALPAKDDDFRTRTVQDMIELLAHLEVDRFVILSQASDLRFALAMQPLVEERMLGIIGCAAQFPLQNAAQYERMDKWQRFIHWNARYAPQILPFLVKSAFMLAQRIGKERLFEAINGGSQADMQGFSDPSIRRAMVMGSNVSLSEAHVAHRAFSLEVIDHEDNWLDSLRNCTVPVALFQGDQDPQTPLETVNEIIAGMKHIEMQIIENAGQILFFTHWPLILPHIKKMHGA